MLSIGPILTHSPPLGRSLAPGAQSLLRRLTDQELPPEERVDIKKQIRSLDIKDWALILRAFDNWPFAPEVNNTVVSSPPPHSCALILVLSLVLTAIDARTC